MPDTTCHMSISLDGFVAGPDQSREHPLGKRGRELHGWHLGDERANEADETAVGWLMRPRGAYVMGRNMFGPIRGEWEEDWRGWWGPEPPYHAPVFVLTHHAREPIEMEGGTTFHFVTDGFDAAYAQARETASSAATRGFTGESGRGPRWRAPSLLDGYLGPLTPIARDGPDGRGQRSRGSEARQCASGTPEVGPLAVRVGDSGRCLVDVSEAGLQLARR